MIKAENISKTFDGHKALDSLNLSIGSGEFYGLLGPNGAGKTTSINILCGLLTPDSGNVTISGKNIDQAAIESKKMIGVVPQEIALYDTLSAVENLKFWGGLYNLDKGDLSKKIDETLHLLGLFERGKDAVKTYSGGMKRRINIAAALLHSPQLLFMDEPTVGIDPQSRNKIYEVLETLKANGMTIVYTTHYMEEAERMCDRIGIIDHGKLIAEGSLEELKLQSEAKDIIELATGATSDSIRKELTNLFSELTIDNEGSLRLNSQNPNQDLQNLISFFNRENIEIDQIHLEKVNLESVFLNLTGRKLRD